MEHRTQNPDYERKHQEDLQRIRKFRLLDDDFMTKVFEDKKCAEFLLQIILQRDDLTVKNVSVQTEIKNLQGRSIRMDIYAEDIVGKCYNVEVQRSNSGAAAKRARYNSSLIDANITEPGDKYEKLTESYVIFITENDPLGGNRPIYHIDRTIRELEHKPFGDGTHILYVNAQIQDDTALGKLMHDFSCADSENMHYKILADRVRFFKKEGGVEIMCQAMEEMRKQEREEGRREGRRETILSLVKEGILSVQEGAKQLDISVAKLNMML